MDYKRLRHTQIILDSENPRLPDCTSSDKEAINRLIHEGYDHLLALARDLIDMGEANPAELPIHGECHGLGAFGGQLLASEVIDQNGDGSLCHKYSSSRFDPDARKSGPGT